MLRVSLPNQASPPQAVSFKFASSVDGSMAVFVVESVFVVDLLFEEIRSHIEYAVAEFRIEATLFGG